MQIGLFVAMCICNGYFAAFLSGMGYNEEQVGVLYSVMGAVCLVLQPLFGVIFDKTGRFRLIVSLTFALYTLAAFAFAHAASVFLVGILFAAANGVASMLIGFVDNWEKRLGARYDFIDYPKMRGIGSVIYAVAALGIGYLLDGFGYSLSPYIVLAGSVVAVVAAFFIPNPPVDAVRVRLKEAVKHLTKSRDYMLFVLVMFLTMLSAMSTIAYLPFLNAELGGTSVDIGYVYFISTVVEALMMFFTTRLVKRFGVERMLLVGMAGHFLRCVCFALSGSTAMLYLSSLLQAISWGITLPVWVIYIYEIVSRDYFATAHLLSLSAAYSGSHLIGGVIYGQLAAAVGVRQMLAILSVPALLAAVIFFIHIRRKRKRA